MDTISTERERANSFVEILVKLIEFGTFVLFFRFIIGDLILGMHKYSASYLFWIPLFLIILYIIYTSLMGVFFHGTLFQKLIRVSLHSDDNTPITFLRALTREFFETLFIICAFIVIFIWLSKPTFYFATSDLTVYLIMHTIVVVNLIFYYINKEFFHDAFTKLYISHSGTTTASSDSPLTENGLVIEKHYSAKLFLLPIPFLLLGLPFALYMTAMSLLGGPVMMVSFAISLVIIPISLIVQSIKFFRKGYVTKREIMKYVALFMASPIILFFGVIIGFYTFHLPA